MLERPITIRQLAILPDLRNGAILRDVYGARKMPGAKNRRGTQFQLQKFSLAVPPLFR